MHLIYKITSPSGKHYIGQTQNTIKRRWSSHCCFPDNSNAPLHNAIRKYGKENFIVEIIIDNIETLDEANMLERKYIYEFNSITPNGYNILTGGKSGHEGLCGNKNGMYNKKHNDIVKEKISNANKGKAKGHTYNNGRKMAIDNNGKKYKVYDNDERLLTGELVLTSTIKKVKKLKSEEVKKENMKIGQIKRKETFMNKSNEELKYINSKKALKKEDNGRATFYILTSPDNDNYIVSLNQGLIDFCNTHNLSFSCFLKNKNKKVGQPPLQDKQYYTNNDKHEHYKYIRKNTINWTCVQYKRIKI